MEKKIIDGKVGVIVHKASTDYAKLFAIENEMIARMDKELVEFLLNDSERINRIEFLALLREKNVKTYGFFVYENLIVDWVNEGETFYIEEF